MADDALDVNKMNVRPGGKQRLMHDTLWNGISQSMTFMEDGQKVAKGREMVLQERGISTHGKNKEWMQKELSEHSDFKHEKSMIETFLVQRGHTPLFLPKFHPELNPIERVWAQLNVTLRLIVSTPLALYIKIFPFLSSLLLLKTLRITLEK